MIWNFYTMMKIINLFNNNNNIYIFCVTNRYFFYKENLLGLFLFIL